MYMGGSTLSFSFLKNMSSVLSGSALSPALASQSRHTVYPSRMASSIHFQLSPHAKIAPSSMYIPKEAFVEIHARMRQRDKRTGSASRTSDRLGTADRRKYGR